MRTIFWAGYETEQCIASHVRGYRAHASRGWKWSSGAIGDNDFQSDLRFTKGTISPTDLVNLLFRCGKPRFSFGVANLHPCGPSLTANCQMVCASHYWSLKLVPSCSILCGTRYGVPDDEIKFCAPESSRLQLSSAKLSFSFLFSILPGTKISKKSLFHHTDHFFLVNFYRCKRRLTNGLMRKSCFQNTVAKLHWRVGWLLCARSRCVGVVLSQPVWATAVHWKRIQLPILWDRRWQAEADRSTQIARGRPCELVILLF